jgi:hypothetical protein
MKKSDDMRNQFETRKKNKTIQQNSVTKDNLQILFNAFTFLSERVNKVLVFKARNQKKNDKSC